jgi:hypothetical protein
VVNSRDKPRNVRKKGKFLGTPNTKGRPKGIPNKTTADVRRTISLIAEHLAPQLYSWIARVAKKKPERAADLYLRMIEYHIPKLVRSELTGPGGGELSPPVIHVHFPGLEDRQKGITLEVQRPKEIGHKS